MTQAIWLAILNYLGSQSTEKVLSKVMHVYDTGIFTKIELVTIAQII